MTNNYYDELDDDDFTGILASKSRRIQTSPSKYSKKVAETMRKFIQLQDDSRENFKFTYKAARFEEGWLLKSLGGFYEHKWISDVLRRIKGGKEASVYLCRAGAEVDEELVAVKVYRPRSLRNLKNDHAYREGRDDLDSEGKIVLNDGMQHAMAKRTDYGKNLLHQSWIAYEFTSMQVLRRAGADVPIPYEMADNAILMGYIGDFESCAPPLNEISLARDEVHRIYERVLHNIDILLNNEKIHGDLSAYNILYWEGEITLIDFPQVVSPRINRNAFLIFQRDITRVCEYFIKQGLRVNPRKIAADMWVKHGYKIEPEIDIRLLDAEDPQDWALWQTQSRGKK